jgi:chromosome segregation ATPase
MNILDDLEEYSKLISNVGVNSKKDDLDNKLITIKEKLDSHQTELASLKDSQDVHKNNVDSKLSQLCIDLQLQKQDVDTNNSSHKVNVEALLKELNELKDHRQNMEDYKKVTNDRIEKLVKLFLSINK